MHYYTFHPKDYMSKTSFLEPMEDLAYRRMLDYQYLHESPLPADIDEIAILISMRTHSDSIAVVLRYFFELTDDGYINDRAEQEIAKYQEKSEKARKSANARWKKKTLKANKDKGSSDVDANALQTDSEGNANHKPLTTNHQPLTNNQEPLATKPNKAKGGAKKPHSIPDDFKPTDKQIEKMKIYGINADLLLDSFINGSKANGKKYKCWNSAFSTWINNEIKWSNLKPVEQQPTHPSYKPFEQEKSSLSLEEQRQAFLSVMGGDI